MSINKESTFISPGKRPRIVSIGTANPPCKYTQEEVAQLFGEKNPRILQFFRSGHIKTRHLYLPELVNGIIPEESNQQLIDKHFNGALELGSLAINESLAPLGLSPYDIDFFCCLSTTGFLCPGITAYIAEAMKFRNNVYRADILGMGCNAGLNGLQHVTALTHVNPGKLGLLLCVEICSAAYVYNDNLYTAVVNSLFGDGVSAALVRQNDSDTWEKGPCVVDFESHIIMEAIGAMRFELDNNKLSFYLDKDVPYVIGANVEKPINRLLGRHNLKRRDIHHWIVHSGGKKVIDAIEYNLGLTDYNMRHTLSVLKNYGNLSSASFLFSYKELKREGIIKQGDLGVSITMGPGITIETALLTW
ncbi:MAG: type III polyketide synthase [Desulfobacteraceae bacterium]|nr:type III polyketide synthase [Desulfobacteraceae bacterium]MBC2718615.1 type III polyketide synthase [Desulfobacteraceae bacterium]